MVFPIPMSLTQSAYYAANGEAAWTREDALAVLDWASSLRIGILGVEVWLPTVPGPTIPAPIFYGLSIEPIPGEPSQCFVERSNLAARNFVSRFAWDASDHRHKEEVPYFNFTIGE